MPKSKMQSRLKTIGQSSLNMQSVLQIFSKSPKIQAARGFGINNKEQNVYVFMKKVIPRSVRLICSAEK